jgi:hypothetical protein
MFESGRMSRIKRMASARNNGSKAMMHEDNFIADADRRAGTYSQ